MRAIAAGLVNLGLAPGERVALLAATRPEWMEVDLAILAAGGITVPIYPSNLAAECGYIVWNSDAAFVCVENARQLAKIRQVEQEGFNLDDVSHRIAPRQIITIDETGDAGAISLSQLMDRGRGFSESDLRRRFAGTGRDQLATIVYTSGTTGPPKGVMQTHGNHLAAVENVGKLRMIKPGDVDFFFLPLAHSFARLIEYLGLYEATITAFARSIDTLMEDVRESRPHLIPSVPRIYEKIFSRVQAARDESAPAKASPDGLGAQRRAATQPSATGGRTTICCSLRGKRRWPIAWCSRKSRACWADGSKFLVSGGAPLAPEISRFFHTAGLLILEGYGLTETTPILTVNRPDKFKFGTVGLPLR